MAKHLRYLILLLILLLVAVNEALNKLRTTRFGCEFTRSTVTVAAPPIDI